jgi:hypothetical protein
MAAACDFQVEPSRQYDNNIFSELTVAKRNDLAKCINDLLTFDTIVSNDLFLDSNFAKKDANGPNTNYSYPETLLKSPQPSTDMVIKDTDRASLNNTSMNSIYVRIDASKDRIASKILLECRENGGSGLTPYEYLKMQKEIVAGYENVHERIMANIRACIEWRKNELIDDAAITNDCLEPYDKSKLTEFLTKAKNTTLTTHAPTSTHSPSGINIETSFKKLVTFPLNVYCDNESEKNTELATINYESFVSLLIYGIDPTKIKVYAKSAKSEHALILELMRQGEEVRRKLIMAQVVAKKAGEKATGFINLFTRWLYAVGSSTINSVKKSAAEGHQTATKINKLLRQEKQQELLEQKIKEYLKRQS